MFKLEAWVEHSEFANWGVQWAGHLLGTWCVLILASTPIQVIVTFLKPDNHRATLSWFPLETLYFWAVPALILYYQRRQRFGLVRLLFLSFTLLEYTACYLVWSYVGRVPELYSRLEHSFDWVLLPCTFGLQLAVVKLRPVANALLVLFSMAVRTCFHMRVFKASAAVALFKAALATGLGLLFAHTIGRYMRASYEQHLKQSKECNGSATSSLLGKSEGVSQGSQQSVQMQSPPAQQQQQQQQQEQQQPLADQSMHVHSTEAAMQAMREARSTSKRLKRKQVNIVIPEGIVPKDISGDALEGLNRAICLRFPDSMVLNLAVRSGCVILSFTLRSEEERAGQDPLIEKHSLREEESAQQQQQQQQQQQHPEADDAIRMAVLEWLKSTGLSAKLNQDAYVNVQVDGHVAECKWNAQKDAWEVGGVVECHPHTGTPPQSTALLQGSAAAAKPKISLPSPVAMLPLAPEQQQQRQGAHQKAPASTTVTVCLTASLRNVGMRPLTGWRDTATRDLPTAHTCDAAEPAASTAGDRTAGASPPFMLLARACSCFLPLTVREHAQDTEDLRHADERQVQVTVQLPPEWAHTSTPVALELELWEQHTCFGGHPLLLIPEALKGVAQELDQEWGLVRDVLKQQQQLMEQLLQPQELGQLQYQHVLQEKQAALEEGTLAYLQDLADYLQSWRAEQEGVRHSPEQAAVIDAIGADLLHHAHISGMPGLAHLLSTRSAAATTLSPAAPSAPPPHQNPTLMHASTGSGSAPERRPTPSSAPQPHVVPHSSMAAREGSSKEQQPGQQDAPPEGTLRIRDAALSPVPPTCPTTADDDAAATATGPFKKLLPRQPAQPALGSPQLTKASSSITSSSTGSSKREGSSGLGGKPGAKFESVEEKELATETHWSHVVKATAKLLAWLLGQASSLWGRLTGTLLRASPSQEGSNAFDGKKRS